MLTAAQIGKSIHVKGTITSEEPLVVSGHVEGSIAVTGHSLTITEQGRVDADSVAETIVIDGAAKGRLRANTRMTVSETATVIGDIIAPALSVAEGATVQGRIETGTRDAGAALVVPPPPAPSKSAARIS